jgi:hypothetical protein
MNGKRSRAYRLTLSERGLELYLSVHLRLCTLAQDLLPYGATLQAAIDLLEQRDCDEVAAEMLDNRLDIYFGKCEHFVGGSPAIGRSARAIRERLSQTGLMHAPQIGRIYIAGLGVLGASENRELTSWVARLTRERARS